MQVNSINTNNYSPSFNGVVIHNKKRIVSLGKRAVDSLVNSEVVKSFAQRKDYDLHINAEMNSALYYKIKSVRQGFHGMINNFVAPWKRFSLSYTNLVETSSYIDIWHPTRQEVLLDKAVQKKAAAARKIRLKAIEKEQKIEEKNSLLALKNLEKQSK